MGNIAAGEANKMIDAFQGTATYTANAALFVKLHIGDPGSAGTANPAAETTRKAATMSAASGGASTNSAAIEWTSYPNSTDVISHVSFWTASTGGTFLGNDALPTSATMTTGDTFRIPVGDLDITLTTVL